MRRSRDVLAVVILAALVAWFALRDPTTERHPLQPAAPEIHERERVAELEMSSSARTALDAVDATSRATALQGTIEPDRPANASASGCRLEVHVVARAGLA